MAAATGIMGALSSLFKDLGLGDLLGENGMLNIGGDGMKNLFGMGTDIWQGMQAGDMMDFNKTMAQQSMDMQTTAFDKNLENAEKKEDLNFTL